MLMDRLDQFDVPVWLVNTGWTGGPYGIGHRMNIAHTRNMVRAAINGELDGVETVVDPIFRVAVPVSVPGVPDEVLVPRNTWADTAAYDAAARKIAAHVPRELRQVRRRRLRGGPRRRADRRRRGRPPGADPPTSESGPDPAGRAVRARPPPGTRGAATAWPATRSPSSAPATSAPRPRSGSPRPALADVVLVDIVEGLPQGKGLDLAEAAPVVGHDAAILGHERLRGHRGLGHHRRHLRHPAQAGHEPRRPHRDERRHRGRRREGRPRAVSPDAILIVVTNPLDVMCHVAMDASGFPRERVLGMAGVLDSARFRTFIARELGVSVKDVHAFVLGGHGDTMVPLSRYSTVAGVPITELLPAERVRALEERTANGGAEIVGAAQDGLRVLRPGGLRVRDGRRHPAATASACCPCATYLQGEFGVDGYFVGVPVVLGRNGLERVFEIKLTDEERVAFERSVAAVRELVAALPGLTGRGPAQRTVTPGFSHRRTSPVFAEAR